MRFCKFVVYNTLLLSLFPVSGSAGSLDNVQFRELMQTRLIAGQQAKSSLMIDGEKLLGTNALKILYQMNDYNPLWSEEAITQLFNEINESVQLDGLRKQDYMLPGMHSLTKQQRLKDLDVANQVERELALTESFLRLHYHLHFGKVDPVSLDPNWNYGKRLDFDNPFKMLYQAIHEQQVRSFLDAERPTHPYYHKLRKILAGYRKIEAAGGWESIDPGPTIKPGYSGERVIQLRKRLMVTADLSTESAADKLSPEYDEKLQHAVMIFQKRQSLDVDGKVGKNTLKALNKSVVDRINQIRVNLERLRWIMHEIGDNFLLVDLPGFEAFLMKGGRRVWQGRIQVGKAYTATPVFKDELEYLEFNPTWTIPPSIIKRKILPNLRKDPGYLDKKGYLLLDFNGKRVNPHKIDWKNLKGFPYMVRQPAGKNNALGLVKFIFPNPHFVFLHDTNHRELFDRHTRTFSAGCIRIEKPFELAEQLLATTPGWDRKKIDLLVASGKTKRIHPKDKVPVLITYTTVGVDEQGKARFKPDIYNRDNAVLAGLNGQIKVAKDVKQALKKFISDKPIE
jgi:L,D-transpeptidase YcbB